MEQNLSYGYKEIDDAIGSSAVSCSVTARALDVRVTYKNVRKQASFALVLPSASETSAGMMTSAMYNEFEAVKGEIESMKEKVDNTAKFPDKVGVQQHTDDYLSYTFFNGRTSCFNMVLPLADKATAGIVSAEQCRALDNCCSIFSAERVSRVAKAQSAAPFAGALCYDDYDNTLCLRVLVNSVTTYYKTWAAERDQNDMSSRDYESNRCVINAAGTLAIWDGAGWVTAGTGGGSSLRTALMEEGEFEEAKEAGNLVEGVLYLTY